MSILEEEVSASMLVKRIKKAIVVGVKYGEAKAMQREKIIDILKNSLQSSRFEKVEKRILKEVD